MAQEGATVVICGRRQEPLDAVAAAIRAAGGQAEAVVADVGNEAQYVGAIEAAAPVVRLPSLMALVWWKI